MIDVDPNEFIIARLSLDNFQNLMEFIGNIAHFMTAIIRTKDEITLIIQKGGWKRIEFDYDEGNTEDGYRLISVVIKPNDDKLGNIRTIAIKLVESNINAKFLSTYDKCLILVPEDQLENTEEILKTLK
ncbi:MAG: ACT domain-containing protein [Candidatus Hodarchaeales archaeon]